MPERNNDMQKKNKQPVYREKQALTERQNDARKYEKARNLSRGGF